MATTEVTVEVPNGLILALDVPKGTDLADILNCCSKVRMYALAGDKKIGQFTVGRTGVTPCVSNPELETVVLGMLFDAPSLEKHGQNTKTPSTGWLSLSPEHDQVICIGDDIMIRPDPKNRHSIAIHAPRSVPITRQRCTPWSKDDGGSAYSSARSGRQSE